MDTLFRYAADVTGHPYPAQMSPEFFWVCIWIVIAFCAIHSIRRSRSSPPAKPPARYNRNQRIYHWGNSLLLAAVSLSGFSLFFRRSPDGPFGLTSLQIHVWSGLLFAAGVVFHAVAASLRGDWRSMRPELRDFREAAVIWRNFLGNTGSYPAAGKYDALQKLFHHTLALLSISFTASGVWMWLSAERIHFPGRVWLHVLRLVHDLSALLLVVMIAGHLYFSLIKVNRANLKDIAGLGASAPGSEAAD